MIESIQIKGVATYDKTIPQVMDGLSKLNFVFGSNGSGKTTISRVIANETEGGVIATEADFSSCEVKWKSGTKLESMVYNRDFVQHNFQSSELKGIFTLGEQKTSRHLKRLIQQKLSFRL